MDYPALGSGVPSHRIKKNASPQQQPFPPKPTPTTTHRYWACLSKENPRPWCGCPPRPRDVPEFPLSLLLLFLF